MKAKDNAEAIAYLLRHHWRWSDGYGAWGWSDPLNPGVYYRERDAVDLERSREGAKVTRKR